MLGYKMWLGITEPESGRIKEVTSLEFKNKIIDVDILWDTGGYIQFIFDGISEGHNDEYSWLVIFECSTDGVKSGPLLGLKDNFRKWLIKMTWNIWIIFWKKFSKW